MVARPDAVGAESLATRIYEEPARLSMLAFHSLVGVAARSEEGIEHVPDGTLDAAFFVTPSDGDGTWAEAE